MWFWPLYMQENILSQAGLLCHHSYPQKHCRLWLRLHTPVLEVWASVHMVRIGLEILKLSSASETSLEIHPTVSALRLMDPHGYAPVLGSLALMGQAV